MFILIDVPCSMCRHCPSSTTRSWGSLLLRSTIILGQQSIYVDERYLNFGHSFYPFMQNAEQHRFYLIQCEDFHHSFLFWLLLITGTHNNICHTAYITHFGMCVCVCVCCMLECSNSVTHTYIWTQGTILFRLLLLSAMQHICVTC